MSARQCVRALAHLNGNFWRPQLQKIGEVKAAAIPFARPPYGNQVNNMVATLKVINTVNIPALRINIEIVDPLSMFRHQIGNPQPIYNNEISLPQKVEIEMTEPPQQDIIEKKAARLMVIRRAKMKKHKWRKLQKKMKFVFARKRQRKEMKKEKNFQAMLLAKIKEAEKYDVEEYVASKLKTAHWERPITRVRGFYAPDWVIRDFLRAQEEKRRLNERTEECIRFKNDFTESDNLYVTTPQPLLGSPYTCSVWEPAKFLGCNNSEQGDSRLPSPMYDYPLLIIKKSYDLPKLESTDDELKSILQCFFTCVAGLHDRLDVLLAEVRQMRREISSITYNLRKLSSDLDRKIHNAKCNRVDMADKLYLEQLICLLNGDLRHFPLHNGPFKLFLTDDDKEINLII